MASCLGPAGSVTTSVGGGGGAAAPGAAERDEAKTEQGGDAAPGPTAAAPEPSEAATPPGAIAPSPSTVILGPRGTASAASEPNRVTRPVTEAEAERHLKGVLERSGDPAARCTKTQYSGGWVTVCD